MGLLYVLSLLFTSFGPLSCQENSEFQGVFYQIINGSGIPVKLEDGKPRSSNITLTNRVFELSISQTDGFENTCNITLNITQSCLFFLLTGSNLREICIEFFRGQNIESAITITNTNITRIRQGTFVDLPVVGIDLKTNQLEILEDGAFAGLLQLSILYLSNNFLLSINPNAFLINEKLENFYVSNNLLQCIERCNFKFLSKGQAWIDLAGNRISSLDKDAFQCSERTEWSLDFSSNNISAMPVGLFDHHIFSKIIFEDNPIRKVPRRLCQNCSIASIVLQGDSLDSEAQSNVALWAHNFSVEVKGTIQKKQVYDRVFLYITSGFSVVAACVTLMCVLAKDCKQCWSPKFGSWL